MRSFVITTIFICFANSYLAAYEKPSYATEEVWESVKPYLIPEEDPVKILLDEIFSSSRALLNIESMREAGFDIPMRRQPHHPHICRHERLPGYIFKVFFDSHEYFKRKTEYENWISRVQGRIIVNNLITSHKYQKYFKCPQKWIYPLPENPAPPDGFLRKNYILVEEDMNLISADENYKMWGSPVVTKELIDALYFIIMEAGMEDCARPDNIPFSTDGKIAFIDTETFNTWPIKWGTLNKHLSPKIKAYWRKLTSG